MAHIPGDPVVGRLQDRPSGEAPTPPVGKVAPLGVPVRTGARDLFAAIIAKWDAKVRNRSGVTHQYSLWLGHVGTVRASGKQRFHLRGFGLEKAECGGERKIMPSALNDLYKLFHVVHGQLFFGQAPRNGVHRRNAKTFDE